MRSPFTSLRFARLEFQNFRAGGMIKLAIIAIALIPLIYGGLFLLAFLDPYGNLVNVPAAVVNLDEGSEINGEYREVGQELCDRLVENNENRVEGSASGYSWKFVDKETADKGLDDATYYMELIIPEDFTECIASADTDNPQSAQLQVYFNPSTNLIAQTVGSSMVTRIKYELTQSIAEEYFDNIFVKIEDAADQLDEAVDGAQQLADGIEEAQEGSQAITDNLGTLASGISQLEDGATQLDDGADTLASGADKVDEGAGTLASGASKLDDGAASLKDGADTLASGAESASSGADQLESGVSTLSSSMKQLKQGIEDAQSSSATLSQVITGVGNALQAGEFATANSLAEKAAAADETIGGDLKTYVSELTSAYSTYASAQAAAETAQADMNSAYKTLAADIAKVKGGDLTAVTSMLVNLGTYQEKATAYQEAATAYSTAAAAVSEAKGKATGYLTGVKNTASEASSSTEQVASAIDQLIDAVDNQLAPGMSTLASGNESLASGASQLASGAGTLKSGTSSLASGAESLEEGTGQLASGADTLADGTGQLAEGAASAASGALQLEEGSDTLTVGLGSALSGTNELHDGIADGVDEMNDNVSGADEKADMMSEPVTANGDEGAGENITTVKNYGTGFAPYFIGLGMWVGALMVSFLIRSLNSRILMSRASSASAVLASYIPMAIICIVQAMLLLLFIQFGLGMTVKYPLAFYLFGVLTACCFAAIIQFFRASLGTVGLVVIVVLLMLQLCTAAGTFPIETELVGFQILNPVLPMTYVVGGFRMAMCGLSLDYFWPNVIVLVAFMLAFLCLTALVAKAKRHVSMATMYPPIKLAS